MLQNLKVKLKVMKLYKGKKRNHDMKNVDIMEYKDNLHPTNHSVAEEAILHVEINEMGYDVIISPSEIKAFVYGNLLSEGFIKSSEDVITFKEKRKQDLINVTLKLKTFEPSFLIFIML
jgi:formate dehydrogenase assembly factor FdhD